MITDQLEKCPSSLILLEEAEYVHEKTLTTLRQFMDDNKFIVKPNGRRIMKSKAMLGIITDF